MKNDRFFVFLLIGIAIIVVISFVFVLSNQKQASYIADDTPEGVVNNYLLAWVKNDYATIEKYLVDDANKPNTKEIMDAIQYNSYVEEIGVTIEETIINEDTASVTILTINSSSAYDTRRRDSNQVIKLVKQDGDWKVSEAIYPFWNWDWYQTPDSTNTK
jgi:hypothetical protein